MIYIIRHYDYYDIETHTQKSSYCKRLGLKALREYIKYCEDNNIKIEEIYKVYANDNMVIYRNY